MHCSEQPHLYYEFILSDNSVLLLQDTCKQDRGSINIVAKVTNIASATAEL